MYLSIVLSMWGVYYFMLLCVCVVVEQLFAPRKKINDGLPVEFKNQKIREVEERHVCTTTTRATERNTTRNMASWSCCCR
jgi:hypothetical protein